MGYQSENAARIVFDIETAPLDDAADFIEPATAPANYKDPAKIAEYIAQAQTTALASCALDVDLCRVVAVAWWEEGHQKPISLVGIDEALTLRRFWVTAEDRHLIGFNCLGFDLPVLLRRSLYLGVNVPMIQIDRFKHPQVTDLMQVLSFNGALKYRGLAFYCRRFGIEVPDPMTGADVGAAVAAQRWAEIAAHVEADVQKTARLATRLGLFTMPQVMA